MSAASGHSDEVPGQRAGDRLESWKEIAAHLGRDERTVRRWEKQEGLPVHRHVHQRQASVYAYKSELDLWRKNRSVRRENEEPRASPRLRVNWARVVLGGLVWSIAYNLLTGAAWFALLRHGGLSSFHPLLGSSQEPTTAQATSMILLTLIMGLSAMLLHVVVRSRYGPRSVTSVYTAVALWLVWGLVPNLTAIGMQALPAGPLVVELASKLVVIGFATLAGASLYRDTAPPCPSPRPGP
jgi:hypothetical protein